ncbi:MAG TPA: DNA polymerase III subunit delta', partial [Bdellovibrionales bacterium]|nr:DNA polymerase III subunit delta' [Bdellovibrionales bacterium]
MTSLKSQLIGNDLVWERLIQLESKAKLPTAMAFVGPEGVGKLKMAKALVQWTLCDSHS